MSETVPISYSWLSKDAKYAHPTKNTIVFRVPRKATPEEIHARVMASDLPDDLKERACRELPFSNGFPCYMYTDHAPPKPMSLRRKKPSPPLVQEHGGDLMRKRVFNHDGREYTLTAHGPETSLDAALSSAEALVRISDSPLAGMVNVRDCVVRITWGASSGSDQPA